MFVYNLEQLFGLAIWVLVMPNKEFQNLSERQRNILHFMAKYIDQYGFPPTIREIGEATGINSTSVVNYNLNKLVNAGYLQRSDRVSRGLRVVASFPGSERKKIRTSQQFQSVPLIGHIVASQPVEIPSDIGHVVNDFIEIPPMMLKGADPEEVFALKVKGDSMIDAMIREGDIVIMKHQETAENGDMVAVWLDERGETTLKYFFNEGSRIRLQPAHPTMEPIYVNPDTCQIRGKVLSVIRM